MNQKGGKSRSGRRQFLQTVLGATAGFAGPLEFVPLKLDSFAEQRPLAPGEAPKYTRIRIPQGSHAAIRSAAEILKAKLGNPEVRIESAANPVLPKKGEIAMGLAPAAGSQLTLFGHNLQAIRFDGYAIAFDQGRALILGNRPRSLLYAAGDFPLWRKQTEGRYVREPDFELRLSHGSAGKPIAQVVAQVGANLLAGDPAIATLKGSFPKVFGLLDGQERENLEREQSKRIERSKALLEECRNADVPIFTSVYGNDFEVWSPALYRAVITAYPSAKGVPVPNSWEKASLCPSDPMTWKVMNAYIRELVESSGADGFLANFWDRFGIYCQDQRCVQNGLNKFPNEVWINVKNLYETVNSLGKKLIVRTWSSGCPHWLGDHYVHAPGYGNFGGSADELWGRVIHELPADIILQTKVYNCDVEPDPPFSPLIGRVSPHTQIAEYQIIGQTTGRYYFPASSVNYTAATIKKSLGLIGAGAGVSLGYGATMQTNFSLLDDIINGINIYAARELSWNVNASMEEIWNNWAMPIYGPQAAPHIINALKASEEAVNLTFSVLGLGSSTNSDFAGTIARKETLLRYTNRYYLPEYAQFLEPSKENIGRVIDEKRRCLQAIDSMFSELELAKAHLPKDQADELKTRFTWFREFAICRRYLDESLWRYRYLRFLASKLTTEPEQMKYLAEAYDQVNEHAKLLFQFEPGQKFSCYDAALGQLRRPPALGDPVPVMRELYAESRKFVEDSIGPDALPQEWRR